MSAASVAVTPTIPVDPNASQYTRFVSTFEPSEYSGWIDESLSAKTTAFLGDLSPLLKIRVHGPQSLAFLEWLTTNSWATVHSGQSKYAIMCEESGHIVGEGLCLVLDRDDFLLSGVIHAPWANFQLLHGRKRFNAEIKFETEQWFIFQLQGPKSREILSAATADDVTQLKYTDAKQIVIDECTMWCLRQGVTGELGFELWGPAEQGQKVYKALQSAGKEHGLRQLGGRSKIVNQPEAAFTVPTVDFVPAILSASEEMARYRDFLAGMAPGMIEALTTVSGSYTTDPSALQCTPYDLGLGKLIKFDHEFVGRAALEKIAERPPRKLVSLIWNADDVADVFASLMREGENYDFMELPRAAIGTVVASEVRDARGRKIGFTTSRCYSPFLKAMISLCVMDEMYANIASEVIVVWGADGKAQKSIRAIVQKAPYKRDRRREL